MSTWRDLLASARAALPDHEARRVVEQASGHGAADLVLRLDESAPERAVPYVAALVQRRAAGEPLQYVLGRWGFRTLDLYVDPRVLIPRPETEEVAGVAIAEARSLLGVRSGARAPDLTPETVRVVDLGTGSGAIALSVAVEVAEAEVWATDVSADAAAVARANLAGIGRAATRVRILEGSWFDALPSDLRGHVDVVVSNPPYVADSDELPEEVAAWEPPSALLAGPDGLDDLRVLVAEAPAWLARPGSFVVELAPAQADVVAKAARDAGAAEVEVRTDMAGRERMVVARWR